ncbi:MAG: hypothetical protein A6F71_00260 [Cycloclasticus sp. symbiont of Poecilosclerida sp. M]|nr:MAG: hypothetical protein A6F71_00260 [Cycloclasticus sp. symbiont of Poecilosclerida sp. M]
MKKINKFLSKEPAWRPVEEWSPDELPPSVKDWLSESGSLTRRIKNNFAGEFGVQLQEQGHGQALPDDAKQLMIGPQGEAFIREVVLTVAGNPVVFARTTVPNASLQTLDKLTKLGNIPLGEVIFSYPDLQRPHLQVAKILIQDLSEHTAKMLGGDEHVWARRNTYKIEGCLFLVSEFFLPIMFEA